MDAGFFAPTVASLLGINGSLSVFAMRLGTPIFDLKDSPFGKEMATSAWFVPPDNFYRHALDEGVDVGIGFCGHEEPIVDIDIALSCSEFGPMGIRSMADAVEARGEYVLRNCRGVAVLVLPCGYWGSNAVPLRQDVLETFRGYAKDYLHLTVPPGRFGCEDGCMLSFFRYDSPQHRMPDPIGVTLGGFQDVVQLVRRVKKDFKVDKILERLECVRVKEGMPDVDKVRIRSYQDTPPFEVIDHGGSDPEASIMLNVSNATSIQPSAQDDLGHLLLCAANKALGYVPNLSTKKKEPLSKLRLRRANLARESYDYNVVRSFYEGMGLEVHESHVLPNWLENIQKHYATKVAPPFEQCIMVEEDTWKWINTSSGIRDANPELYDDWSDVIDKRLDWPLWDFSKDDLVRALIKGKALYAAYKGLGKTRFAISFIHARGGGKNLVLLERRLFSEFIDEARSIGYPVDEIHQILNAEDAKPENLKTINLLGYSMVWRGVDKQKRVGDKKRPKKTIAHVLRKTRFNTIAIDEVHNLASGKGSKQGEHALLLRSKHKVGMTGTPIANYPKDLVPVLIQVFGEATEWVDVSFTKPIEDLENRVAMNGRKYFSKRFVTYEEVVEKFDNDKVKRREMPVIRSESLDEFRSMIAPIMIRRHRHEPDVAKAIRIPKPHREELIFPIDQRHASFYSWWLDTFFAWFKKQLDRERLGQDSVDSVLLLRQLGKLQFATNIPQADEVTIEGEIAWPGGLTAKQQGVIDKSRELFDAGEKIIIFSVRPKLLDLFDSEFSNLGYSTAIFHGSIPLEQRLENLTEFKNSPDCNVLLATYGTANTGYNIPQADSIISVDWDWVPSTMEQAESRILRSAWLTPEREARGQKPKIFRCKLLGTIDEYMQQLVRMKSVGSSEAIDYQQAEINPEDWMSWKDFTIQMFKDLGLEV